MEHKKKMVKYGGEEISEDLKNKIEKDVIEIERDRKVQRGCD